MFKKNVLGLAEAQAALEAIIARASENPGMPVSVVVVDDQCELVCAARMDGATPMFNYMALKKARSCAITGKNTRSWKEFLDKRSYTANDFIPDSTRIPGGVAIVKPGDENSVGRPGQKEVFGGIGVSGRSGDEDEALSITGLKALQKAVWG